MWGLRRGLCMQDAAQVHLEIGRRIFRSRMELDNKEDESGQRREFQKLVFLSNIVFGEQKARFLLPWKRVFQARLLSGLACRAGPGQRCRPRSSQRRAAVAQAVHHVPVPAAAREWLPGRAAAQPTTARVQAQAAARAARALKRRCRRGGCCR